MSPSEREQKQTASLAKLAEHVYKHVPFYRRKFDELGVKPGDIP